MRRLLSSTTTLIPSCSCYQWHDKTTPKPIISRQHFANLYKTEAAERFVRSSLSTDNNVRWVITTVESCTRDDNCTYSMYCKQGNFCMYRSCGFGIIVWMEFFACRNYFLYFLRFKSCDFMRKCCDSFIWCCTTSQEILRDLARKGIWSHTTKISSVRCMWIKVCRYSIQYSTAAERKQSVCQPSCHRWLDRPYWVNYPGRRWSKSMKWWTSLKECSQVRSGHCWFTGTAVASSSQPPAAVWIRLMYSESQILQVIGSKFSCGS